MDLLKAKSSPRGPQIPIVPGRPVIGNALEFWDRPLGFFIDAYHKYGPVFRFEVPMTKAVVIAGSCAHELLDAQSRCPMDRKNLFRAFSTEVGVDVFETEGDPHKNVRKLLKFPYSRQIALQFAPEIKEIVEEVIADWSPGQTINLFDVTSKLSLFAMMSVVTPIDLRSWSRAFMDAGSAVMYTAFRLMPFAALKAPHYRQARDRMRAVIDETIERHAHGEFASNPKIHMVDACLQATNSAGDKMDRSAIRGACFYALAGTEIYIGRLVGFIIFELLKNRGYLARVMAEVDAVGHASDGSFPFRQMPRLRAAYFEALRCYPLIPAYPYTAQENLEFHGYTLSKGELILFAPYIAHFSHTHYTNPMAFDPERHLPPRREFARPGNFTPFGIGEHACLAQGLVETVTLTIVTSLLRCVEIELERPSYTMNLRMTPLIAPRDVIAARVTAKRVRISEPGQKPALTDAPDFDGPGDQVGWIQGLPLKEPVLAAPGEWLIQEGEIADAFFVLLEGQVSIWETPLIAMPRQTVTHLEGGSSFGETGLLKGIPRTASVKVERPSKVLRFSKAELEQLLAEHDVTAAELCSLYYGRYINGAA